MSPKQKFYEDNIFAEAEMSPKMRCQQNEMSSKLKFSQNKNWIFKFNSRSLALIALALLFCDNDHIRQGRGIGGGLEGDKMYSGCALVHFIPCRKK